MGKSTSAQLLARDHGYVYYEADAFAMMLNPFVDLHDDNPSMATAKQRILKGENNECIFTIPSLSMFNVQAQAMPREQLWLRSVTRCGGR